MKPDRPLVSVIIPVYNDAERLGLCLDALCRQTYPEELLEIIVVDNGSSEDIRSVCLCRDGVRFEEELVPSSYAARNRGIEVSKGTVLAFTDSDCIPESNWVESGVAGLLEIENVGLVGGQIKVFPSSESSPTAVEIYEMVLAFPQSRFITKSNFSATANLFTLRSVLKKVGHFRPDLKSGGDFEWGRRVKSSGFNLSYAENVVIAHPARRRLIDIIRKARRIEGGHHDLRSLRGRPTLWQYLFALLTTWPSIPDCTKRLRELDAFRPTQLMLFCSILAADRLTRVLECLRLKIWGESRRA